MNNIPGKQVYCKLSGANCEAIANTFENRQSREQFANTLVSEG